MFYSHFFAFFLCLFFNLRAISSCERHLKTRRVDTLNCIVLQRPSHGTGTFFLAPSVWGGSLMLGNLASLRKQEAGVMF